MNGPTFDEFARPGDPDFESFPRHLSEDTVYYSLHLLPSGSLVSAHQKRTLLNEIRKTGLEISRKLLKDYIWQRESFSLDLCVDTPTPYLTGKTEYGDAIADEWLIVYLLLELSKRFEDAWIRVFDADGEFLLIEAANVLPKWLNPEVADNRVWLNQGQLRIVPREVTTLSSKTISQDDALIYLTGKPDSLIHSPIIEEEAFYRLRGYPQQITESLHTTTALIPRKLAYVLRHAPAHITSAVDAFYLRDPISMRPLLKATQPLRFPPEDLVLVSVRFTRVGYAQLKSQEFAIPPGWISAMRENQADGSRVEIGMKVSCGFDMLVADPQNKGKRAVREINILLEELNSGDAELPDDADIKTWPLVDESEKWLDVNFEDFENELSGSGRDDKIREMPGDFGDRNAQSNLRKMVERFEHFLNDDKAGVDGAGSDDDMDFDDEQSDEDDKAASSGEDEAASFDEEQFEDAMREMMGLPVSKGTPITRTTLQKHAAEKPKSADVQESEEDEEIRKLSELMETELKELGALNRDPERVGAGSLEAAINGVEDEDRDDAQYLLAKNLLEAFRGQSGTSGPASNLMNMLGVAMPRDESDSE